MSNYAGYVRNKGQNLLIVEGNHEKNILFDLLFKCFPEINIDMDYVWIYGTNIYMLYDDIIKEYGEGWTEEDIDLPFIISRKQKLGAVQYKQDFVNIILVFDYERHDPNFSERKIQELQDYFVDSADTGRLYLNYPMIESYQHLQVLPDKDYEERRISVTLQPGKKYKNLVKSETGIAYLFELKHRIMYLLEEKFEVSDRQIRERCCESLLSISDETGMSDRIRHILQNEIDEQKLQTAVCHFRAVLVKLGYLRLGQTYWEYMRAIIKQVIFHNVCKAQKVQHGKYQIDSSEYRECFGTLNLSEILKRQNTVSRDEQTGFIWVLNTCVFFIAEYNFSLAI